MDQTSQEAVQLWAEVDRCRRLADYLGKLRAQMLASAEELEAKALAVDRPPGPVGIVAFAAGLLREHGRETRSIVAQELRNARREKDATSVAAWRETAAALRTLPGYLR